MKNHRTTTPFIALAGGLLALTACGSGGAEVDAESVTAGSTEPDTTAASTESETADEVQSDLDGDTPGHPEQQNDDPLSYMEHASYDVGDEFYMFDSNNEAEGATLTYEAFHWFEPEYVDGHENYGVALISVDNTEATGPLHMYAPIEGAGWHYLSEDRELNHLIDLKGEFSSTYTGRIQHIHSGPYTAGTRESDQTLDVIIPDRDGQIVYVDDQGNITHFLEVPDESINEDHEVYQEIYQIADSMFDGRVASE